MKLWIVTIASVLSLLLFLPGTLSAAGTGSGKSRLNIDDSPQALSGDLLQWLDVGAAAGLRLSTLYQNGDGVGFSPETFIRGRILFRHNILFMAEAGYYQNILPIESGTIKADFFSFGLLAGYNLSIIDKGSNAGGLFRNLSLYAFTGPVVNVHLTSLYEKDETGEVFSFDAGYNMAFLTWSSGIGISLQVWRTVIFFETGASVSLGNSMSGVASDEIIMSSTGETGISFRLGTQLRIMPW